MTWLLSRTMEVAIEGQPACRLLSPEVELMGKWTRIKPAAIAAAEDGCITWHAVDRNAASHECNVGG